MTGTWGFPSIPDDVTRATVVTVMSWADRSVSAYGVQEMGDGGRMMTPDIAGGLSIPNAAKRLLEPYKRTVVV